LLAEVVTKVRVVFEDESQFDDRIAEDAATEACSVLASADSGVATLGQIAGDPVANQFQIRLRGGVHSAFLTIATVAIDAPSAAYRPVVAEHRMLDGDDASQQVG
jgi:hypothetical protein